MSHAVSEIDIRAPAADVMRLAFDLPAWPGFLPHYRWVRVLEESGGRLTVEMACRRGVMPLRWRSHLWISPEEGRMRFHHIAGPARGMDVEWTVREENQITHVAIRHDLTLNVPVVRSRLGQWVVSEVFVKPVAARTLAGLKRAAEKGI